jgi:hypothetical protein
MEGSEPASSLRRRKDVREALRQTIEQVVQSHCDGTYNGLHASSNFVEGASPVQMVNELTQAVLDVIGKRPGTPA